MKHLLFMCVFGCTLPVFAQQFPRLLLSHNAATGVYSSAFSDPFSQLINPAAVTAAGQFSVGVYGERRFQQAALQQVTMVMQFPFLKNAIGIQTNYFGSSHLNESSVGMVFGKKLGRQISSGVGFNYYQFNAPGYLRASSLIGEAGFLFRLTEELISGIAVRVPTRRSLGKGNESLRPVYQFGIGYQPSEKFYLMLDAWKEEGRKMRTCVMMQYVFLEGFRLRGGWHDFSSQLLFSAGVYYRSAWLDIAVARHPFLGYSSGVQLLYAPVAKP